MKRSYIILIILIFSASHLQAQVNKHAILLKKIPGYYKSGDTINLNGLSQMSGKVEYYLAKTKNKTLKIRPSSIRLLPDSLKFWDKVWFNYASEQYYKNPGLSNYIDEINQTLEDYISEAKSNSLILEDEILYEYLYGLLHKIIPGGYIKNHKYTIRILVVNNFHKAFESYSNGLIILNRSYLLSVKSERELAKKLANQVAEIILDMDYNPQNLELKSHYEEVKKMFQKEHPETFRDENDPALLMALYSLNIKSAWTEYTQLNYMSSLKYLQRYDSLDILSANEIVLKSKLYRKLYNNPAKNLETLNFLNQSIDRNPEMIDLYMEKTLILMRLEQYEMALKTINIYIKGLENMEAMGTETGSRQFDVRAVLINVNESIKKKEKKR